MISTDTSRPAWDSTPRRRRRRAPAVFVAFGCLFLIPGVAAAFLRLVPPSDDGTALVASFIPYGLIADAIALLWVLAALVRARHRVAVGVVGACAAALLALQVSWQVPYFVSDHRAATSPAFSMLSLNMYDGSADPAQVWDVAQGVDVVVLLEVTPAGLKALKPYGWDKRFPYSVGDLAQDTSDTAIYSRFRLTDSALLGNTSFQQYLTTVAVPDLGAVRLIAAHPCNPYCGHGRWASEHALLYSTAKADLGERLVIAGDFNAVDDHGPMLQLRALGMRSATDLLGAGWLPTWPANKLLPALIPIDHVLVNRRLTTTSLTRVHFDGTDHLGLLTTVAAAGP